jgi:succinate dehydrogenase / fumarate reductase flavoprotein subunit
MRYPNNMQESIEIVEKTREVRLKKTINHISPEERERILSGYHPDRKKDAKTVVNIGPNSGESMVNAFVELLEALPLIDPSKIDLSYLDFDVDVLIIGGGVAGCIASLWANYCGIEPEDILISQKLRLGDSNTKMATGGMQIAVGSNDDPLIHYLDTMGGGHYTNKPDLVKTLVKDAPLVVKWLEELGVMFTKNLDGTFMYHTVGGTSRSRALIGVEYMGMEIMRVLEDEISNLGIGFQEFSPAVELLKDERGRVAGAVLCDLETEEYYVAKAKSTIVATGGCGRLHFQNFPTTNHYGATADGVVIAYRAGARLIDMDSVQYHPTGAVYPEPVYGRLCTEKLRSYGAMPVNRHGKMFVHPLEPRDVESAAIIRECFDRDNGIITPTGNRGVWLDVPMVDMVRGEGTIKEHFSAERRAFKRFDIDIVNEPVLVFPTIHFQNGGIEITERAETNIPGLFGAGEVVGGVHGINRLGANALVSCCVFGRKAGMNAAKHAKKVKLGKLTLNHVFEYQRMLRCSGVATCRKSPILLPEYRGNRALTHSLDFFN